MLNCQIINKHSAKNTLKTIKYYESANWATISSRERLIQVSAEVVAEPVRKKETIVKGRYQKMFKTTKRKRNNCQIVETKLLKKCQKEKRKLTTISSRERSNPSISEK